VRRKLQANTTDDQGRRVHGMISCVPDEVPMEGYVPTSACVRVKRYLGKVAVREDGEQLCTMIMRQVDDPQALIPKPIFNMIVEKSIPAFFDTIGGIIQKYPAFALRQKLKSV
jgi:hypothetical protein